MPKAATGERVEITHRNKHKNNWGGDTHNKYVMPKKLKKIRRKIARRSRKINRKICRGAR